MKKILIPISIIILLISPYIGLAHPGRTASDGCHYCRTNCASWGEVQGARHCHGGYSPPSTYTVPITTSLPTPTPTPRPTFTPTPTPKETSIPISTPTLSPEIKGEGTKEIQDAEESGDSDSGMLLPLGALGLVGGYWFYKKRIKMSFIK